MRQRNLPKRYRIHKVKAKSGAETIVLLEPDGYQRPIHSPYDPEGEARALVNNFELKEGELVVILGLGLGYHVKALAERYPFAFFLVVEPLSEIKEMALEIAIIEEVKDRVEILSGEDPQKTLTKITRYQMEKGMRPLRLFRLQSYLNAFPEFFRPLLNALDRASQVCLWNRLRYPKFQDSQLTVALVDFDYFMGIEISNALRMLGNKVVRILGKKDEDVSEILRRVIETLLQHRPDFILTVNHIGFDEEGVLSSFLDSLEMPVASWYVDSPNIIIKAFTKNVNQTTSVFVWDKRYLKDLRTLGFESVEYLPLATDPEIFRPLPRGTKDSGRYQATVGFVGNSMVYSTREYVRKLPKHWRAVVERLARHISQRRDLFDQALQVLGPKERSAFETLSPKMKSDLETAVLRRATFLYRLSCIRKLREFKAVICGDKGWKKILPGDYFIQGPLNYYRDLPWFYNRTEINFNATSLQMHEAVNQRVFDVPACGGFLLTDHLKVLHELFDVGKEIVVYEDLEEIPEKVRYYLRHSGQREKIAQRGRERVLKEHTYIHRLQKIVETMRARYA